MSLAVLACAGPGDGTPRIEIVGRDAPLTTPAMGTAHVEPYLATFPEDPDTRLAGAIAVAPGPGRPVWTCVILRSADAGRSWERTALELDGCVDPWIAFPAPEVALFAAIEVRTDAAAGERLDLVILRSADRGRSWRPSAQPGARHDHELLAVDRADGTVYLTAQRGLPPGDPRPGHLVPVYRSTDGGASFETVANLRPSERPLRPTGLEVLSDGSLVLTIHDRPPDPPPAGPAATGEDPPGPTTERDTARRAWASSSTDGGRTWSTPSIITETCGPAPALPGYPMLAVDATEGPFRDRLYHACVRGGLDGIAVTASDDAGRTWSDPVRADGRRAERPTDVRSPAVAVDAAGTVGAVWYRRAGDGDGPCQHLFFTASVDGGRSFLEPVRVSERPSCPERPENARIAESWPTGADYGSLEAGADGVFRAAWADARGGTFQIRHAALRVVRRPASGRAARVRPRSARTARLVLAPGGRVYRAPAASLDVER